jgi:fatty acid-binding protein DegV
MYEHVAQEEGADEIVGVHMTLKRSGVYQAANAATSMTVRRCYRRSGKMLMPKVNSGPYNHV